MFIALAPLHRVGPHVAVAAARAGALGVLDVEFARHHRDVVAALAFLERQARGPYGVQLDPDDAELRCTVLGAAQAGLSTIILTRAATPDYAATVASVKDAGLKVFGVVTSLADAVAAEAAGVDALIAKGSECGGWIGEETAFVLTQHLLQRVSRPIWVKGGIGLHTAAAALAAGAAGVVLDDQLLLTRESGLSGAARDRVAAMDGSETHLLGASLGAPFRGYARPGARSVDELTLLEAGDELRSKAPDEAYAAWIAAVRASVHASGGGFHDLGQDAAFAAGLARRHVTVGGIIGGIREAATRSVHQARKQQTLSEGSPLARRHGTRFPIVQGPMTRVSDRAGFADAVATTGALAFLALAVMRAPEIERLLGETNALLQDRPWGVGILGFVPPKLREEQLEVVRRFKPPFALIAGGRPDQARALDAEGIHTYLHVPSPGLLKLFLSDGARRFVFEGRECGGHIGPRTSFVLWETMINVLLEHLGSGRGEDIDILFAGGVHDGLSAAMVAAMAAPIVERGVHVGVLVGTAYLFTREAVATGAITQGYQDAALQSGETNVLEATPGYATRCLPSPFVEVFAAEKRRLVQRGLTGDALKHELEFLNIGRLRMATKGVDRDPDATEAARTPRLIALSPTVQWQQGLYMSGQIAALRDDVCGMLELHEDIANGTSNHLRMDVQAEPDRAAPRPAAVAIVGMAAIVPGASTIERFWANIMAKRDGVTEVPRDRWDVDRYFDPDKTARDKIYSRWGGFIDEVPFDPVAFGMPPSSIPSIEPFQLLALLMARDALADAGYAERPFPRATTSVILGAGGGAADLTSGYVVRSSLPMLFGDRAGAIAERLTGVLPEWTEDSFPGFLMNVAAGRIANRFDFGGANYTVDAACASSLAAVHLGVRELEAMTSDMVVAGGVDAVQTPFGFLAFSKTQALSPTGRSRPFDASADGIAISEGFAAVVLKRLEDAERDGDRIYAVIRGTGASSDGRDRSLTAPRPAGQVRAYARAYAHAGFSPASVGLIEAHGTGTVAGDQAELASLRHVFEEAGASVQGTAIGSVKSMIGHTKATAGVVGLSKVAKALHHRVLPPTLGVSQPNTLADITRSPFYVNTEARPWVRGADASPRRAGVSAFGFGGTNFHIVLEEHEAAYLPDQQRASSARPAELLAWRSATRADLLDRVQSMRSQLLAEPVPSLADLAYTTSLAFEESTGRAALTVVAGSVEDLVQQLQRGIGVLAGADERMHAPTGVHFSERPMTDGGRTAFLFPGQGSQYVDMGRELAVLFPDVRAAFDLADDGLLGELGASLSSFVFPPPSFTKDEADARQAALTETNVAQLALGATELGMLRLLERLGVEPDLTAGHSFGELVALHAAGALTADDLVHLAATRGRLMAACAGEGTMAAIVASPASISELVRSLDLTLANFNTPTQTVVSGPTEAIERLLERCQESGLAARRLPVAAAFHSPLVAQARAGFAEALGRVELRAPQIPVYSNTSAAEYVTEPSKMRSLLADHLVRPVRFVAEIEAMYAAGARVFLEVGPRRVLSGLVAQILGDREHLRVPLDDPARPGLWSFLDGVAALAVEGVPVAVSELFAGRAVRRLDLSRLSEEAQPHHSTSTWMVSGGRARPLDHEPVRATLPIDVACAPTHANARSEAASAAPLDGFDAELHGAAFSRAGLGSSSIDGAALAHRADAVGAEGVMQHFQQVMDRFLDVQASTVTAMLGSLGSEHAPAPAVRAATDATDDAALGGVERPSIPRYLLRTVAAPSISRFADLDPDGVVVIAGGGALLADALAERLMRKGVRVRRVDVGAVDGGGTAWSLPRGADRAAADRLVAEVHAAHERVAALIYLVPTGSEQDSGSLMSDAPELFVLLQALQRDFMQAAIAGGSAIIGVTAMGGSFGCDVVSPEAVGGWVPGLLKCLAQEWPSVRIKAVDLPELAAAYGECVIDELYADDGRTEIGYRDDGTRLHLELSSMPLDAGDQLLPLGDDAVILATGGSRGITAEACVALAERFGGTFVLIARTPPPTEPEDPATASLTDAPRLQEALLRQLREGGVEPSPLEVTQAYQALQRQRDTRRTLQRIEAAGARVDYRVCDVQDERSFGRLIDDLYVRYGRIDVVIHGAGVVEDRPIESKSLDSFRRVMGTKLTPAAVMRAKLRPTSLRCLAFFSSVTARAGNPGQTDYGAANEALNKLAQGLDRRWPGRVVSFNWGPWFGAGMVTSDVRRRLEERGLTSIPVAAGRAAFVHEVLYGAKGDVEVTIAGIDLPAPTGVPTVAGRPDRGSMQLDLPLLGQRAVSARRNGSTTVRCTLAVDRDHYLAHHVLDAKPVVPFAVAMELMAEAVAVAEPGRTIARIDAVRALNGIVLEGREVALEVAVHPPRAAFPDAAASCALDAALTSSGHEARPHYRGTVRWCDGDARAVDSDAWQHCLAPLAGGSGRLPLSLEQAYEEWLFHGPVMRTVASVEAIGPAGVSATLRTSDPTESVAGARGDWILDPLLLDAAFQLQLLWGRMHWDVTLLPSALRSFVRLNPSAKRAHNTLVRCELRMRSESRPPISHADIVLFDAAGRPSEVVLDLQGSGSAVLNRGVGATNWRNF